MDEQPRDKEPLELRPRPRAARLNRLVLAVIGLAAIAVLWIGMWAVGRRPQPREPEKAARSAGRPLDVDRLQRATRVAPAPPSRQVFPTPPPAPPSRGRRSAARTDPEALRAQRALDAPPVQSAFANPAFYGRASSAPSEPRPRPLPDAPSFRPLSPLVEPPAEDPSRPDHHEAFLAEAAQREPQEARQALLTPPPAGHFLVEGSLLPAILTAGINSDLPGQTTALIRQNVYDSISGRRLLVPAGARLIGSYDHRVAWGQRRVLVAWQRLVFPDGSSLDLAGMPGADLAGEAGVRDRVNNRFVRTFGSAVLLSAFSAGAQLSQPQESSSLGQAPSARQIVAAALGQEINRTATLLLRRNLDVQPTLEIRPGYEFFVQLTADLAFAAPYAPGHR